MDPAFQRNASESLNAMNEAAKDGVKKAIDGIKKEFSQSQSCSTNACGGDGGDGDDKDKKKAQDKTEQSKQESKSKYGDKIKKDMARRGWDEKSVEETIANPDRTVKTTDYRYLPDGARANDPATAFINKDGSYVVRNNNTGDIVQVSNRLGPWKSPF